jgi:DNA-binding MarR family transcriptional regulator
MSIQSLITNPGRLRILTALASEPKQEFVQLRGTTQMTDGNLATHARRLHSAGLLMIDKQFRAGKPVTTFTLTEQGREALVHHVQNIMRALEPGGGRAVDETIDDLQPHEAPPAEAIPHATAEIEENDWID